MAKVSKKAQAEQRRKLYIAAGVIGALLVLLVIVRCSTAPKPPEPDGVIVTGNEAQGGAPQAAPPAAAPVPTGISIGPADPAIDSRVELSTAMNLEKAGIVWLVNGARTSTLNANSFSIKDDGAKKGDIVQAVVKIGETEYRSNEVVVKNSAPVLTKVDLKYEGTQTKPDIFIEAEASDPDGDKVLIEYEWSVEGNVVSTSKFLKSDVIKRGTEFKVSVVPFDGELRGAPVLLRKAISNIAPQIDATAGFIFDGSAFSYQVKATDPDGDILRYGLVNAPGGMKIDEYTGFVTWTAPPSVINSVVPFTVTASDNKGGSSRLEIKVTFTGESIVTKTNKKGQVTTK